ncbi:MAG TPA: tRNA uridine-5-carboxymethylaminomethyl(34) synthesis GTPase MnmE, partial [Desulfobacteraceae bacterium]|nr:tRNA uridine-5-carboxymethylaminomethyl(34) synthesis GTPase MnmE [Desulfobacteraceae bacterium]
MAEDTIAAIATPVGSGGIGIIKISGRQALPIAAALFRPFRKHTGFFPESHQLYYGHIVNDEQILDEVLLAVMKAPHSYTGEDVVEIQAHAGTFLLKSILESVLKQGARLAHPGEFTKRAFLNGRIDLTQAEAVMDLICAKSTRSLDIAAAQLRGGIREEIEAIRQSLLSVLSAIEAGIDFPEDMGDDISAEQTIAQLNAAVFRIREMISRYRDGHVLKEGLKVLVIGRPNVGKSSLMNRLLGRDRVIVTPIPGTTRDLIEESLTIQGIPIILADSAGLHEGGDLAEQIGMEKTCQYIDEADLILFMLDASALMTPEDWQIYEKIRDTQMIA